MPTQTIKFLLISGVSIGIAVIFCLWLSWCFFNPSVENRLNELGGSYTYEQLSRSPPFAQAPFENLGLITRERIVTVSVNNPMFQDHDCDLLVAADKFPTLHKVEIESDNISNSGIQALTSLQVMTRLSIKSNSIDNLIFTILNRSRDLLHLKISSNNIDQFPSNGETLGNLRSLTLHCPNLDDAFIQNILHMKKLKELDLSGTQISDKSLDVLSSLPSLNWLSVTDTKVSPKGLAKFRESRPDVTIAAIEKTDDQIVEP